MYHLENDAGYPAYRKGLDKQYPEEWRQAAEDNLISTAEGMQSLWAPVIWNGYVAVMHKSPRYEVAFGPGKFFAESLPRLSTFLNASMQ